MPKTAKTTKNHKTQFSAIFDLEKINSLILRFLSKPQHISTAVACYIKHGDTSCATTTKPGNLEGTSQNDKDIISTCPRLPCLKIGYRKKKNMIYPLVNKRGKLGNPQTKGF